MQQYVLCMYVYVYVYVCVCMICMCTQLRMRTRYVNESIRAAILNMRYLLSLSIYISIYLSYRIRL